MTDSSQDYSLPAMRINPELERDLVRMNPWWVREPMRDLPETRRHLVASIHRRMQAELAPIVVVRGPRQIGKTIAQLHVVSDLLQSGVPPKRILRIQCDELTDITALGEPILRIVDWYEGEILRMNLNACAREGAPAYLFLDEVQNLKDWAPQLKHLVDHVTIRVVVTGSSALRIERGRDSLAGRITTIDAGVLTLTEIGSFHQTGLGEPLLGDNGIEPLTRVEFWRELRDYGLKSKESRDVSFKWFSDRGGYPLGHQRASLPWSQLADQLNENVIKRVIKHDLRVGERGRQRDPQLLEEVFRLACRYAGEAPGVTLFAREAQRALGANVGPQRIQYYLRFLDDTLLLRLIPPLEIRLKKRRGNSKLCLADHGLRASWLQEVVPLYPPDLEKEPHLTSLAGRIAESVVGATLSGVSSLDLAHSPERGGEPEVDFVLTIGTRRIPLEVKYQRRIDPLRDTEGLRAFLEKSVNHAPFGLLVVQTDDVQMADPRIVTLPLSTMMLIR